MAVAIYHLSMKPMSRASGRSAVAAAAYRSGEDLENERDGERHDFTRRSGVEHVEIVLPSKVNAPWAKERSRLWNSAEAAERRKDARVAREIEVSLPHELEPADRLALVRDFSQNLAERFGVAVDFAIHAPHGQTDERNHHAHLMLTTRRIEAEGLGEKSLLEWENKKLVAQGLPTTHDQLRSIRVTWEEKANLALARAGLETRVDHRSHAGCGLAIAPTQHVGVHATQMQRRGMDVSRVRLETQASLRNAQVIRAHPGQVLALITQEKSVFDRYDIARALHRMIDQPEAFQSALARVMASRALVELQPERRDADGVIEPACYSTRQMVQIERDMAAATDRLSAARVAGLPARHVQAAIRSRPFLTAQQKAAIDHVTGEGRIATVVGLAGAGKSTLLAAAREAWEAGGYQVHGAALAGKAAEGLQESSGIASRTLASWQISWQNSRDNGFDPIGAKDVFVIDEAGMVGSRQLAHFVAEADRAGAKIVLVGDPEQLQPIGAGAAFRAIAERTGFAQLEGVRRQQEDWQRAASVDFGRHRTAQGLAAYEAQGAIRMEESTEAARAAIVREVLADREARPDGSRLVLAHRRVDVQALNQAIRQARQGRGELAGEIDYPTSEGQRSFAAGDRVLFRQNDRTLGVKNGMLGTVERAEAGRLEVRLDSAGGEGRGEGRGRGKAVAVDLARYAAVDHGYATTIHKSQGSTVERTWVLASGSMDRHLTYVAMTRHRDGVRLYAGQDEFEGMADLSLRLSRGGAKETTLDYDPVRDPVRYAQRRGIGEGLALESDIVVPKGTQGPVKEAARKEPAPARTMTQALSAQAAQGQTPYLQGRDGKPEMTPGSAAPVAQSPDRLDVLADYLQLRLHHENRALREGRELEQKFSRAPERERATAQAAERDIQALKPPGLFAGKAARAEHEARRARLDFVGQAAQEAEAHATRQLAQAHTLQTEAPRIADGLIEKEQPGLVARMQPLMADSKLVQQAEGRLAERAAHAATLQQVERVFGQIKDHANGRLLKSFGYGDDGSCWKALPEPVRVLVEGVNRVRGSGREVLLQKLQESLRESPQKALALGAAMKAAERSRERGLSR